MRKNGIVIIFIFLMMGSLKGGKYIYNEHYEWYKFPRILFLIGPQYYYDNLPDWDSDRDFKNFNGLGINAVKSYARHYWRIGPLADTNMVKWIKNTDSCRYNLMLSNSPAVYDTAGYRYSLIDSFFQSAYHHTESFKIYPNPDSHRTFDSILTFFYVCNPDSGVKDTFLNHLYRYGDSMVLYHVEGEDIGNYIQYYMVAREGPEAYCIQCYDAIEELAREIKSQLKDTNSVLIAWLNNIYFPENSWTRPKPEFWTKCKDVDMIAFGLSYGIKNDISRYDESIIQHEVYDTLINRLDTCVARMKRYESQDGAKHFPWIGMITMCKACRRFPHYYTAQRYFTREEMECQIYIGLSRGMKGLFWGDDYASFRSIEKNNGKPVHLPSQIPIPSSGYYSLRRGLSEFGDNTAVEEYPDDVRRAFRSTYAESLYWNDSNVSDPLLHCPESYNPSAPVYDWVKDINMELADVGRVFVDIEWIEGYSLGKNHLTPYLQGINGYKKKNGEKVQYSEIGVYKDTMGYEVDSERVYIMVVNRYTAPYDGGIEGDSVIDTIMLRPFDYYDYTVDMNNYRKFSLNKSKLHQEVSYWFIDSLGPGEGRLYALVDGKESPLGYPTAVYSTHEIINSTGGGKDERVDYRMYIYLRGELFRRGPRARDVDSVRVRLYRGGKFPVMKKDTSFVELYKHPELWGWSESLQDSCYTVVMEDEDYRANIVSNYLIIELYNSYGKRIDSVKVYPGRKKETNWALSTKDSELCYSMTSKAIMDPRWLVDPSNRWNIVYTGEIEDSTSGKYDTVVYYYEVMGGDIDTIGIGRYPCMVSKGDTIGVSWVSTRGDSLYYRYCMDGIWSGTYCMVGGVDSNGVSIPSMVLYDDEVYLGYEERRNNEIGMYIKRFGIVNPANIKEVDTIESWYESGEIDMSRRGVGLMVDEIGDIYMIWIRGNKLLYGVNGVMGLEKKEFWEIPVNYDKKINLSHYGGEAKGFMPMIAWIDNNRVMLSLFHPCDTIEVKRDTIYEGDGVRGVEMAGGGIGVEEGESLRLMRWDAVGGSYIDEGKIDTLSGGGCIDGISYVKGDSIIRNYYMVWTGYEGNKEYMIKTYMDTYRGDDFAGVMPYCYIKGGIGNSSIFTGYRDGVISSVCDKGYDSLVYNIPVRAGERKRLIFDLYTDDKDYVETEVKCEVNNVILWDGFVNKYEERRVEIWVPEEVIRDDTLNIKFVKMNNINNQNSYIPVSKLVLESYEVR